MNGIPTYENPVIRGFSPDPSVVRVGEDYYCANSTFQYFPAVTISHSRDLVHWRIIGHALTRDSQLDLRDLADSHGIWAPDFSYHDGTYYIFATLRLNNPPEGVASPLRVQLVVTADKPEGPYGKPLVLPVDTIDPSLFIDDDGKRYLVVSPGVRIARLSDDCTEVLEEPRTIWEGTGRRCPEGPRLFKKDGWYYALLAEGGTGHGHCVTVARSRSLNGPYLPCPFNPVLTQSEPDAPIQRCGHGQLVQTHTGEWWMLYLCGRDNDGRFTTLGRETALDPVSWTEDGWFTVNGDRGPSLRNTAPKLPASPAWNLSADEFDSPSLLPIWEFVRNPDPALWSLTARPGFLRLLTSDKGLNALLPGNVLLRREEALKYTADAVMEFAPEEGDAAGLTCYYGVNNYLALVLTKEQGARKVVVVENRNGVETHLGELPAQSGKLLLRMTVSGQTRSFYADDGDGNGFRKVACAEDCTFLSDEGVTIGKHHTGTMVGFFAHAGKAGRRTPADFDYLRCRWEQGEL